MNMKLKGLIAATLFSATSFSAFAATLVDESQTQNLQPVGSISVTGVRGSIDDVTQQLSQKANEMGASHYRVVRADTPGDSSLWSGNAEIYR